MIQFYITMINAGILSINDVPESRRDEVIAALEGDA